MRTVRPQLVGLPDVLALESPASWVTRAALSQGATLREFTAFLGVGSRDVDQDWLRPGLGQRLSVCGLSKGAFAATQRVMAATQRLDPGGHRLLLWTKRGRPRYRVCPLCARSQRAPYFGIHCRYAAWCYCPEHHCLLEDACWSCRSQIELPWSLVRTDGLAGKCAYLSECFLCTRRFGDGPVIRLSEMGAMPSVFSLQLENGRALLAALYRNEAVLNGRSRPISAIRQVEALGLLRNSNSNPLADWWRQRCRE
ncbi:TniQ family protein [Rhizobacter sp. J219]|uniref:TniQ family protein n=1 Tax=Rhizobacter sp. J219 TaxID=2898430 RepID=UPI0035AEDE42